MDVADDSQREDTACDDVTNLHETSYQHGERRRPWHAQPLAASSTRNPL
jgi:hypothetical protein